jgi:hypothetical protein
MPIRSIDYKQSKIKGPMHGLRPKSNNPARKGTGDNSFVFSSDVRSWYESKEKAKDKAHNTEVQRRAKAERVRA